MRLNCWPMAIVLLTLIAGCKGGNGPVAPPTSETIDSTFTHVAPDDYAIGKTVYFDGSASRDELFKIVKCTWDFGDGSDPETSENPGASHVFTEAKTYEVKLTIVDLADREASSTQSVRIYEPGSAPQACFTYDAPDGWQPGSQLAFDASCSSDADNDIATYEWDWGDGTPKESLSQAATSHIFHSAGDFQVSVRVIDSTGRESLSSPVAISTGYPLGPHMTASVAIQGTAADVEVSGSYAYVAGFDPELSIYDISDPTDPKMSGEMNLGGEGVQVLTSGNYAYLSGLSLKIVDISDRSNPTMIGSLQMAHYTDAMALWKNRIIVGTDYPAGVDVVDITDPANPSLVGSVVLPFGDYSNVESLAIAGDYVYASSATATGPNDNGFAVIDLTQETTPKVARYVDFHKGLPNVLVSPELSYLFCSTSYSLQTYDIGNPADPVLLKETTFDNMSYSGLLHLSGSMIYMQGTGFNVARLDVSDPLNPRLAGGAFVPYGLHGLGVSDSIVCGVTYSYLGSHLGVIDFKPTEFPNQIGSLEHSGGRPVGFGKYLYSPYDNGIEVYDLSNPSEPVLLNTIFGPGCGEYVKIAGTKLVAVSGVDIGVFGLTDPIRPALLGRIKLDDYISHGFNQIEARGNLVYLTGMYTGSLEIIDISAPDAPSVIGSLSNGTHALGNFALFGDYAYIGEPGGIAVVDVSDPKAPKLLSNVLLPEDIRYLSRSGEHLFASSEYTGKIFTIDIGNRTAPAIIDTFELASGYDATFQIEALGNYLYAAESYSGLLVLDISNPSHLTIAASCPPGNSQNASNQGVYDRYGFFRGQVIKLW